MLAAFEVGGKFKAGNGFSIVAGHTDSPCIKIKKRSDKSKLDSYSASKFIMYVIIYDYMI